MLRALTLLLCGLFVACASPESGGPDRFSVEDGAPGRVTYVQYGDRTRMTLVNEAHTDPVEAYTERRADASTKVTSNEVFAAMLGYFGEQGWSGLARSGFAPLSADGVRWALEVETETGVQHLAFTLDTPQDRMKAALECKQAFLEIFNLTQQSQAIDNGSGRALFDQQQQELQDQMRRRAQGSSGR
jgi:hypothetical protein